MAIRFAKKTRKNCKKNHRDCNKDAKKATQLKCRMKTCRAKKYQAVYGTSGGSIRSNRQLFY
jgi:hypothetical protein